MKRKTISIIGSGWLGAPLAVELQKYPYNLQISSRSDIKLNELLRKGLNGFKVNLNNIENVDASFWKAHIFIITVPPVELYVAENLAKRIEYSNPEKVIVTSSTAVYPNSGSTVIETDAVHQISPHSKRDLLEIEECYNQLPVAIVRYGGLFGEKRQPGMFLQSGKTIPFGEAPVNMTHLQDAIGAIQFILKHTNVKGAFNVVSPVHPTKREFYSAAAKRLGFDNPTFFNDSGSFKVVSSKRLIDLGYSFKVENPIDAI